MNDAANRPGRGSGTLPPLRRARREADEEELETGEPIDDEVDPAPVKKRIRARVVPFSERDEPAPRESTESSGAPGGQMVLATAKYMPAQPPESDRRTGRKRGRAAECEQPASSLEGQVFHSGKWGGMLAMVVALIWFFAGLANDVIFFYPPILFLIGLGAFMKDTVRSD